jgi:membrane fusion protein (multidrug efflux system)
MRMRYVVAIIAVLLVVGGLAGVKYKQISGLMQAGKEMAKAGPPPEIVSTAMSDEQTWEGTLYAVGSVAAVKGVTISNDAPGVVSKILFESGAVVKAGQVLVELDSSVERAQLASAQARRELAVINADRSQKLVDSKAIPQAQLDNDNALLKSSRFDVGSLAAQIDRKTVRAPFGGKLGIRTVNLGQYLNPGTPLTVLEAIDNVYIDFSLPQQRLADLKVGMPLHVTLEGSDAVIQGTVAAIDPTIDSMTRTIKLRGTVPNKTETLRPGMFATVRVVLPQQGSIIAVPATAVVHASFGDSVFVVEDKKDESGNVVNGDDGKPKKVVRQQFVRLGEARGDFVAVLDGVKPHEEVVVAGAFKLRNGAGVVVNNDVKSKPELTPHPPNH